MNNRVLSAIAIINHSHNKSFSFKYGIYGYTSYFVQFGTHCMKSPLMGNGQG